MQTSLFLHIHQEVTHHMSISTCHKYCVEPYAEAGSTSRLLERRNCHRADEGRQRDCARRAALRSLAEQVKRLNRKLERERVVLAALPDLSLRIVEFAREHGRVTMADAIRLTGSNRNTLKQHLRALVERGHLAAHGAGRGAWYALR